MLTDREHGFTIIELLIVCILLTLAVTMATAFLLDGWRGARQATGTGRAQADSNEFMTQLGSDVRQALGVDRSSPSVTDADLRTFVRTGAPTALADVRAATDTQFWIVTDAIDDGSAGRECVGYVSTANQVERRVFTSAATCPQFGTPADRQVLLRTPAGIDGARFTYVLEYNPDVAGGGAIDVDRCRTWRNVRMPSTAPATIPSASRLPSIVAVQVDATAQAGAGEQEFAPSSSYSLVSRRTSIYRKALGCSY